MAKTIGMGVKHENDVDESKELKALEKENKAFKKKIDALEKEIEELKAAQ